jgi:hypothetical protein
VVAEVVVVVGYSIEPVFGVTLVESAGDVNAVDSAGDNER